MRQYGSWTPQPGLTKCPPSGIWARSCLDIAVLWCTYDIEIRHVFGRLVIFRRSTSFEGSDAGVAISQV